MSGILSTCQNCGGGIVLYAETQFYAAYEVTGERHVCPALKEREAGDSALREDIWRNMPQGEEKDGALPHSGPDGRLVATATRTTDPDLAFRERSGLGETAHTSPGASQGLEGMHRKSNGPAAAGKRRTK